MRALGITPNAITFGAIFLSIATGISAYFVPEKTFLLLMPLSLFLRMALNALDGMMAREYQLQSKAGEVLNELGDVVSDFILFFPIGELFHVNVYLFIAFLFLSVINEYAGILAKAVSQVRRYDGPMGKSDRAFVVGLICLILYFYPYLKLFSNELFALIILLLIISTSVRIYHSIKTETK